MIKDHDGDYVEVFITTEYNKIYYCTKDDKPVSIEVMERKSDGTWRSIGFLHLQGNKYPVGEDFDYAPFKAVEFQQGYYNMTIGLHLTENRTIEGKTYDDCDIIIKAQSGMQVIR
ncbi:MAG: hypothetical protein N2312_04920 [Dictyoglomaceae bacterium]|nr:hypothetical protein [Dictyoglomaceae bacterium]